METLESVNRRDYYKNEAEYCLELLRSGTEYYKTLLHHLRNMLEVGGITLEEIGITEKELRKLEVNCCMINLKKMLSFIRLINDVAVKKEIACSFLREAKRGGFTLEEIGTSKEELKGLTRSIL